jgi:hypothetical protein
MDQQGLGSSVNIRLQLREGQGLPLVRTDERDAGAKAMGRLVQQLTHREG